MMNSSATHLRIVMVTVTYGDRGHLVLETVRRAFNGGAAEAIVVLNGVTSSARAQVEEFADSTSGAIKIIDRSTNGGSAVGFAEGIRAAERTDADLVWILDDDNWVDPECLRAALQSWRSPRVRSAGGAIMCARSDELEALRHGADLREIRASAGNFCGVDLIDRARGRWARWRRTIRSFERLIEVPYGPYGGLLIAREHLQLCEGPDTRFVLYGDDYDWTRRLGRAGLRFFMDTEAVVREAADRWGASEPVGHFSAMLTSNDRPRIYFALRNAIYFSVKYAERPLDRMRLIANASVFSGWILLKAARARRRMFIRIYVRALQDALLGLRSSVRDLPSGVG